MNNRIAIANETLASFTPARIERRTGGWYVRWKDWRGQQRSMRWELARGSSHYPRGSRRYPMGGTGVMAIGQLIKWCKNQPVQPIGDWRCWSAPHTALLPETAVDRLEAAGYPSDVPCVLCGEELYNQGDWWNLNGVSGPACNARSGCRQRDWPGKSRR